MGSKRHQHFYVASLAAATTAALLLGALPASSMAAVGAEGPQSGGIETSQSGEPSTSRPPANPSAKADDPDGQTTDKKTSDHSVSAGASARIIIDGSDATDAAPSPDPTPSPTSTPISTLPVGGPLTIPPTPRTVAAATAASTASTAPARPEYLLSVERGTNLGQNSRYTEYAWAEAVPWNWASPQCSSTTKEGSNLRLISACTPGKLLTTVINPQTKQVVSRKEISVTGALPIVGAVGKMSDGYIYLVTGQQNLKESDSVEVIRILKYDTSLKLLGKTGLKSGSVKGPSNGIVIPFYAASTRMTMTGSTLYLHSSKLVYKNKADGLNHQTNLTLELNAKTMSGLKQQYDYGAYASHSFNQFVRTYGNWVILVDHGDAYPRTIRMVTLNPKTGATTPYTLLSLQGSIGDNLTHSTVNGLEIAGSTAAVVGISAPHNKAVQGVKGTPKNKAGQITSNVYFSAVNLESGTQTFSWITTNHPTTSDTIVGQPTITALPSGNFAILFSVTNPKTFERSLHYRLVNPAGKVLDSDSTCGLTYLPIADPVLVGDMLYWIGAPQRPDRSYLDSKGNTEQYLSGIKIVEPLTSVSSTPATKYFTKAPDSKISGTAKVGSKLTASPGTWSPKPSSYTYQWYRDGIAISGATSKTYKPVAKDWGRSLTVSVTGNLKGYATTKRKSPCVSVRAQSLSATTVSGTPKIGAKLTAKPGTWSPKPSKLTYQWYRNGKAISGATSKTYTVKKADKGKSLRVHVRYTWVGTSMSETFTYYTAPKKILSGFSKIPKPTISGTSKVGKTLSAKPGTWSPKPSKLTYQWYRNGKAISGATSKTYTVKKADKGKKLTVKVTACRSGYASEAKTSSAKKVS